MSQVSAGSTHNPFESICRISSQHVSGHKAQFLQIVSGRDISQLLEYLPSIAVKSAKNLLIECRNQGWSWPA